MKTILILAMTGMLVAAGCTKENYFIHGEGRIQEIKMDLDQFHSVNLRGSMNVEISYGEKQEVVAVGHANIIDHLETRIDNGSWEIGLDQGSYSFFQLTVYITLPELQKVGSNGSGDILVNGFDIPSGLSVENRASGKILLNSVGVAETLDVKISGSGPVYCEDLPYELDKLAVNISGSGSFKGFPAVSNDCVVKLSGSGNCEVKALTFLDVQISGSGNVFYKGHPEMNVRDNGSGGIFSRN